MWLCYFSMRRFISSNDFPRCVYDACWCCKNAWGKGCSMFENVPGGGHSWHRDVSLLCNRYCTPRKIIPLSFFAPALSSLPPSLWTILRFHCRIPFVLLASNSASLSRTWNVCDRKMRAYSQIRAAESSTRRKPRRCLSFKVLLSRVSCVGLDTNAVTHSTAPIDLCLPGSSLTISSDPYEISPRWEFKEYSFSGKYIVFFLRCRINYT